MSFWEEIRDFGIGAVGAAGSLVQELAAGALAKARENDPEKDPEKDSDPKHNLEDGGQDTTPAGSKEDTAASNPVPQEKATQDPKSLFWDPFAIIEQLGYKDRPTQLTYLTLKSIMWRTPIIRAIAQTRIQQIAAFAQPQHDRYQLGYRVKLREQAKEPTKVERDWIQRMENVIQRTGVTDHPRGRDDFETFLRKFALDSLTYDQACFEVVPDRKGRPCEWYAIDGASIRLADSASLYINEDQNKRTRYVQIYDSVVVNEYNQEELCFGIRNPCTDLRLYGYGVSELEMLISAITSILYAWEFNQKFFSQGSAAKGIINFKGTVPEKQLQAFRRHWYQMLSGVQNSWRTPITNADELQYVNLQQSSRDMEFNAWMDFLIKVACAMFTIDPVEINFKYGNAGQRSTMQEGSNREKITESKERGLRPLLRFIERCMNRYILWPINESFEFDFVGLDALTRQEISDLNMKRVKSFRTVDELRAEDDLEPLPDGQGEVVLDPVYLQFYQIKQAQAQQEASGGPGANAGSQMGEGQPPGAPGTPPGTPPGVTPPGGEPGTNFDEILRQYEKQQGQQLKADKQDRKLKAKAIGQPEPEEPAEQAAKSLGLERWVINL